MKNFIIAVAVASLPFGAADAAVIFSENFGTLADGTTLVGTTNSNFDGRIGTGTPTGNNILEAQNPSSWSGASALMAASTSSETNLKDGGFSLFDVGTLSFSLQTNSNTGNFLVFLGNGSSLTGNSGFTGAQLLGGWQINNGQLQARTGTSSTQTWTNVGSALTANTIYEFNIVFNGSGAALTDYYLTNDLAAGAADIWINGVLFGNDIDIIDAQSVAAMKFYVTSNGGSAFELDNVLLQNVATVVPEPTTGAMLIGSIGAMFWMFRRKKLS